MVKFFLIIGTVFTFMGIAALWLPNMNPEKMGTFFLLCLVLFVAAIAWKG